MDENAQIAAPDVQSDITELDASASSIKDSTQESMAQQASTSESAYAVPIPTLFDQLAPENRQTIEQLIERAIARQEQQLPVSPLLLCHDGLKLTVEVGKQVMNNILFSDRPSLEESGGGQLIQLPEPTKQPSETFETLMCRRKSVRDYTSEPVSLAEVASLCHSTAKPRSKFKTNTQQVIPHAPKAPTGGGLLSTHLYYIALNTIGLDRGIYKYRADEHALQQECRGELRGRLFEVASLQDWIVSSAGVFVIVSDLDRIIWKYEDRAYRLAHMDAGVLGQSLHLAATSIDLGSCLVFGFLDDDMNQLIGLDGDQQFVSLLMPIGKVSPQY